MTHTTDTGTGTTDNTSNAASAASAASAPNAANSSSAASAASAQNAANADNAANVANVANVANADTVAYVANADNADNADNAANAASSANAASAANAANAATAATAPNATTSAANTTAADNVPDQLFTHLDSAGQARMVDVTNKVPTVRSATAAGFVRCGTSVIIALRDGTAPKGDVLAVARIAGIQGAKKTADLLPLAHVIGVHGAVVDLIVEDDGVRISATVRTADRTGVEMEAFTAVSVAALAVVDMVKGLDKSVTIENVRLLAKTGGKSGDWLRETS